MNFTQNIINTVEGQQIVKANTYLIHNVKFGDENVFVKIEGQITHDINNQFLEPINSSNRYVEQRQTGLRKFENFTFCIQESDGETLQAKRNRIIEIAKGDPNKKGAFEVVFPTHGRVLVATKDGIKESFQTLNLYEFSLTLYEVSGDVESSNQILKTADEVDRQTLNVFEKMNAVLNKALDYSNATLLETQNAISNLNSVSFSINTIANKLSNIDASAQNLTLPFTILSDSIKNLDNSIKTIQDTPSDTASSFTQIYKNFFDITGLEKRVAIEFAKPAFINANNSQKELFAGTELEKQQTSQQTTTFQVGFLSLILQKIPAINFDNLKELENLEFNIMRIYNDILNYRIFLTNDKYGDPTYFFKDTITQEEQDMISALIQLATASLEILSNKKQTIQKTRQQNFTNEIDILTLNYLLYGHLQNVDFTININSIKDLFYIKQTLLVKDE